MKRYRIKVGDLKVIEEHPAGDLVSLKELGELVDLKEGDPVNQELMNLLKEIAIS